MSPSEDRKLPDILREVANDVMIALGRLSNDDDRQRVLNSVSTLFGLQNPAPTLAERPERIISAPVRGVAYSQNMEISPKEFMREKNPQTDVERIACLAYYLTQYRNTPYFKTLELSQLNTEAAQQKFSNATVAAKNATNLGYLAAATKGQRQISAAGEQFVRLLPDRNAAREEMAKLKRRKKTRKKFFAD